MGTKRTLNGHLFPARHFPGGWSVSIQADKAGYACSPRSSLETLEEYTSVEVALYGPFPHTVDVKALGLPADIVSKFLDVEDGHPCIGAHLKWDEVATLEAAVAAAADVPWAGIPRGFVGWSDTDLYIGCDSNLARDVCELGTAVLAGRHSRLHLAKANASDDGANLVRVGSCERPRVLDLRNAQDRDFWMRSGISEAADRFTIAMEHGIDGIYAPEDGFITLVTPRMLGTWAFEVDGALVSRLEANP